MWGFMSSFEETQIGWMGVTSHHKEDYVFFTPPIADCSHVIFWLQGGQKCNEH